MQQDDPLRHTLEELTSRIRNEVAGRIDALTLEVAAAEARGRQAGREAARGELAALTAKRRDRTQRLLDALAAMDEASSLHELLDALTEAGGALAAPAALFILRGQRLECWRFAGFTSRPDLNDPLEPAIDDAGALSLAARHGRTVQAPGEAVAPHFAPLPDGGRGVAIPLVLAGEVAAVLYADEGETGAAAVHVVEREQAAVRETRQTDVDEWDAALRLLARYAARCLESMTALGTARFVADHAGWPFDSLRSLTAGPSAGNGQAAARPSTPLGAGASADGCDERMDEARQAAHRYARLLVSEIKLYHEDAIAAGRRERDLMTRLAGEIARAQALYDERVPPTIRQSTDFFRAELVKTLAGGDESLISTSRN